MKSETAKLPKGQTYPLKPSFLDESLASAGVNIETYLIRSPGNLFDAHFWPPESVPFERLYVRIGSVPMKEGRDARSRFENVAVPALIEWIKDILAQDIRSPVRRERQYLDLSARPA